MLQKIFHFVLPAVTMCCNVPFSGGRDVTSLMYEANVQSSVLRYWCLPSSPSMCGTFLVIHITRCSIIELLLSEDTYWTLSEVGGRGNGDRCGDGWGCGGGGRWHWVERGRFRSFLSFFLYLTKNWRIVFWYSHMIMTGKMVAERGNVKRDSSSGSVFIAQLDIFMIHSWIKLFHQWS